MEKIIVSAIFLIPAALSNAQVTINQMFKNDSTYTIKENSEHGYFDSLTFNPHTVTYEGFTSSSISSADEEWFFPLRYTLTLPVTGVEYFVFDKWPGSSWFLYDHSQYIIILYGDNPALKNIPRKCRDLDDKEVDYYFDLMDFDFKDWRAATYPDGKLKSVYIFYWYKHKYDWPTKKKNRKNFIFEEGGFSILGLNILPWNEDLFKAYVNNTFTIKSDFGNDVLWNTRLSYEKDVREGIITVTLPRYGKIPYVILRAMIEWGKVHKYRKQNK